MLLKEIISTIVKKGPNAYALARTINQPGIKIMKALRMLFKNYLLTVFPALDTRNLGLNKLAVICNNSKLKIETEKRLFVPLINIFRADFEDKKFLSILYYPDDKALKAISNVLDTLKNRAIVECCLKKVLETRKYYRNPDCYDFSTKSWKCNEKFEIKRNNSCIVPDEADIKLITALQVNPSIPYYFHPHYVHIKKVLDGFLYTLGEKNFVIDVISRDDISDVDPNIIWVVKADDLYISELHVSNMELESTIKRLKPYGEIILSPKTPLYAEGYSIPFEIFREKQWSFPKIITESE